MKFGVSQQMCLLHAVAGIYIAVYDQNTHRRGEFVPDS
jgi:hypothetical protein